MKSREEEFKERYDNRTFDPDRFSKLMLFEIAKSLCLIVDLMRGMVKEKEDDLK